MGFDEKHPSCGIISCAGKNGAIEYCFECEKYPCDRYKRENTKDSFISYANVSEDVAAAREDLGSYLLSLARKETLLRSLIARFDNGRMKGFYCIAVNRLPLTDIETILSEASPETGGDRESAIAALRKRLEEAAARRGVVLKLRK